VESEPQWPPTIIRAGETYVEMQVVHRASGGLIMMHPVDRDLPTRDADPSSRMNLPIPWKCVVTYYGSSNLIEVTIPVHLVFYVATKMDVGHKSGDATLSADWEVTLTQIGPPPSNKFTFYMFNNTNEFVRFDFSGYATGRRIENNSPEQIEVIRPYKETRGLFLAPNLK
jgi:hypothetical protein